MRPSQYLYNMAYGSFCPGPSHILQPEHPKYNTANTIVNVLAIKYVP